MAENEILPERNIAGEDLSETRINLPLKKPRKKVSFAKEISERKIEPANDQETGEIAKNYKQSKINLAKEEKERRETARRVAQEEAKRKIELIKEAKKKVLSIVEEIIDTKMQESNLISCCKYLCKQDYEDVNIERSLINICGYPLCYENLPKPTKQRYKISLTEHKVYDLSERKLFCSNLCYKASCYLKQQLAEEPFWMKSTSDLSKYSDVSFYRETKGAKGEEVLIVPRVELDDSEQEIVKVENKLTAKLSTKKAAEARLKKTFATSPYIKEEQLNEFSESMSKLTIKEKNITQDNNVDCDDSKISPQKQCSTVSEEKSKNSNDKKPFTGEIVEKNLPVYQSLITDQLLEQSNRRILESDVYEKDLSKTATVTMNIKSSTKKNLIKRNTKS